MKKVVLSSAMVAMALCQAPAYADVTPVTGDVSGLIVEDTALCDQRAGVTLVVNKTSNNDQVAGTVFTLERIAGIDLATADGWKAIEGLSVDDAKTMNKDGKWSATSDENGKAVFAGLPIGAYLVTAVAPNDGHHRTPESFILTLPVGNENGWICAPTVNAKFVPLPPPATETKPPYPPFEPGTTTTTTVTQPAATPVTPALGEQPPAASSKSTISRLASTGASILGVVAIAAALVASGVYIIRRRKQVKR